MDWDSPNWTYEIKVDEATGEKYVVAHIGNGDAGYITIPAEVDGCKVRSLGAHEYTIDEAAWNLRDLTISDGIMSIEAGAFDGCRMLRSVSIPDSVASISPGVFSDCNGLEWITVCRGNANYSSANDLLLTKDGRHLIRGVNGDVVIPDTVTTIGYDAFEYCTRLTSVVIPGSVRSIGARAFVGCSGLTSVTIPDGVVSIGEGAFSDCEELASVSLPASVTSIGRGAFDGCGKLANPPTINTPSQP